MSANASSADRAGTEPAGSRARGVHLAGSVLSSDPCALPCRACWGETRLELVHVQEGEVSRGYLSWLHCQAEACGERRHLI